MRNLHACLVHESRECVIDLVRNLHHLDPSSTILLYNGSADPGLLRNGFPWERYNAVLHPAPKPMKWGWLHEFALDCMRFGLDELGFDTMTIVDSDQLGLRAGYSEFIGTWMNGRSRVGMLGSAAPPAGGRPAAPPAVQAYHELDLWRRFLRRFERGEQKFVHWTFWPTTVFTAEAARALLALWPDRELQDILKRTKIWASEEVILPTLVALLGFAVEINPCRHDYVRYRVRYSPAQLDAAMTAGACYWAHPIPRSYDDPLRALVRRRLGGYERAEGGAPVARIDERRDSGILPTLPILNEVRGIEGWLSDEEADLLIATAARALRGGGAQRIVEVGAYCGKATIALGRVVQAISPETRISTVDLHDGLVGSRDGKLSQLAPTRDTFQRNIDRAGLTDRVEVYQKRASEVPWDGPIRLLLIDGLHDYASVAADFGHFERWVPEDGFVVFHDYADYFPGVKLFVDELLRRGDWARVRAAGSLVVLRRVVTETVAAGEVAGAPFAKPLPAVAATPAVAAAPAVAARPLISCIMPTADRRRFVPHAIRHFLAQEYPERELVIVDDGKDPVEDLVPSDTRVRYIRLDSRRSIGAKRNIACAAARGTLVAHWDDDDWMAPCRLGYQIEELESDSASIAGLDNIHYYDPASERAWRYRYPPGARRWVGGNTLFYRKALWTQQPFAEIDVGEDARFVWAHASSRLRIHAQGHFFVAMLHGANVGKKLVHQRFWQPVPSETIRALMGADFDVYRELLARDPGKSRAG
jgi:predicted O-methyltransferase YrrM